MDRDGQFPIYRKLARKGESGYSVVRELIEKETGVRPKADAMWMWAHKYGCIPAKFIILLKDEAQRLGITTSPSDFINHLKK